MAPASAAASAAALLGTTPPGGFSNRARPSLLNAGDGSCPQLSALQGAGGSAPLPMQARMNRVASSGEARAPSRQLRVRRCCMFPSQPQVH